jgi:hypothetical protein
VRTCMLAELDQTRESQISLTDPDSRAMAAHTILRRRFDPPRVRQSAAVPALPHIERTFTFASWISLVVQTSSGEPPSEAAD